MEFYTRVAGVTFRNSDGKNRQNIIASTRGDEPISLIRESANPYDSNAIMVLDSNGRQLGCIKKSIAAWLAPQMDSGKNVTAIISSISGGSEGYSYGINLRINCSCEDIFD